MCKSMSIRNMAPLSRILMVAHIGTSFMTASLVQLLFQGEDFRVLGLNDRLAAVPGWVPVWAAAEPGLLARRRAFSWRASSTYIHSSLGCYPSCRARRGPETTKDRVFSRAFHSQHSREWRTCRLPRLPWLTACQDASSPPGQIRLKAPCCRAEDFHWISGLWLQGYG